MKAVFFLCLQLLLGMVLIGFSSAILQADDRQRQPNIIFILADDMGYGDLGCYGHPVAKTPNIDRLAQEGVLFTQHYSNGAECSPTRTAFLTGRYQHRVKGLECAIGTGNVGRYDDAIDLARHRELGLSPQKALIPGALQDAGYACGVMGKWHLGYEPKFNPIEHGWDGFFGYLGGNVHYFNHRETSDLHVLFQGRLPVYREGYMTHLITDAAVAFIERHQEQPMFLYVSHESPHFPFQGPGDKDKSVTKENWMQRDPQAYVQMLQDLDSEVGRLLDAVDGAGLQDNTIVVFVSDNGGLQGAANMGPLRGSKSSTLEGGIRVPLIIRWPGRIKPNMRSHQVSATFDLTRSILRLAKAQVPAERLDGYDIIDHVTKERNDFPRTLFWRDRRGDRTWWAVRDGDLKYLKKTKEGQTQRWLFDVASDLHEEKDLLDAQPDEADRLRKLLADWETDVATAR